MHKLSREVCEANLAKKGYPPHEIDIWLAGYDFNQTDLVAAQAEIARLTKWKERCEELEVVAAALYLEHDNGKEQFDMYRSAYITTADDDNIFLAAIATDKENENAK